MKYLFLALFALIVIGAGGAGAYYYFSQPAEAANGQTAEHKQAKEASNGKQGAEKGHFVELDPLVLPIVDAYGVNQVISMIIVVEVTSSEAAALVTNLQPRLKDAYIQELYGVLNKHAALKDGVLQVGMIKYRLNQISHKVVGDHVVEGILLQVVEQRPI